MIIWLDDMHARFNCAFIFFFPSTITLVFVSWLWYRIPLYYARVSWCLIYSIELKNLHLAEMFDPLCMWGEYVLYNTHFIHQAWPFFTVWAWKCKCSSKLKLRHHCQSFYLCWVLITLPLEVRLEIAMEGKSSVLTHLQTTLCNAHNFLCGTFLFRRSLAESF